MEEKLTENVRDFDEDDIPFASPEIREKYEAALGKFLLAYNEIDHRVLELIGTILARMGRKDLIKWTSEGDFSFRLHILDLLKSTPEGSVVSCIPFNDLRQLSGNRNVLAHGYMDQNPFDGDYVLLCRGQSKGNGFSEQRLKDLADQASQILEKMRHAEAVYIFSEINVPEKG